MKKFILLIASFFSALILAEIFVKFVIGYPAAGIQKKIWIPEYGWMNIYKPDSKYWNVEGGNKVFKRNNIGLPGDNVDLSINSNNIFLLGTSSIQALQEPPDKIASSVFQRSLKKKSLKFNVLNLGQGACDPFYLYKKSILFEKRFKPDYVILTITHTYEKRLKKYKIVKNFREKANIRKRRSLFFLIKDVFKNNSTLFNLIYPSLVRLINFSGKKYIHPLKTDNGSITQNLLDSMILFKKRYEKRFILVSFIADNKINRSLNSFSKKNSINFFSETIRTPENMINGNGHLNVKGNRKLGELFFKAFMKTFKGSI